MSHDLRTEMTRHAVVGYPALPDADRLWIESVRARHDPQATRIPAHFTLVFPAALALDTIVDHAATVARQTAAVAFVLREAIAVPDPFTGGGHVFLVPDEGRAALSALHDRLYEGPLRAFLREDLPFVPHVTIGAAPDLSRCEEIQEEVAATLSATFGTIGSLDVLEIGDDEIRTAARFELTGHIGTGEPWPHASR
jgi:2'-5' RNA ligase